jgi:thioredoxin 1
MIIAENSKFPSDKNFKILNFYSDWCPPCHAFMPNFFRAEEMFKKHYDFITINSSNNIELFQKYRVMWTPTIIILDWEKVVYNQSWVPNWTELKNTMMSIAKITENDLDKIEETKKTKWFFGLF